jgi:hypothetical protein
VTQRDYPNAANTCPACGKLCYRSRREAKRAAKTHGNNRRAYQCGDNWHLASYQPWQAVAWYRGRPN